MEANPEDVQVPDLSTVALVLLHDAAPLRFRRCVADLINPAKRHQERRIARRVEDGEQAMIA
jgi:hypothetical protein